MASLSCALQSVSYPAASLRCPSSQGSFRSNGVSLTLQRSKRGFQISCQAQPETLNKVIEIVTSQLDCKKGEVQAHSKFEDLGADSLDQVEIVMALEEEFDISVDEDGAEAISTVQDAADLIERTAAAKV